MNAVREHGTPSRRFLKRGLAVLLAAAGLGFAGPGTAAGTHRVLFIGNSFTAGMHSAAWRYRACSVHDLNRTGVGGVAALFERFTREAGLAYAVSIETVPGKGLAYHLAHEKGVLDRSWDDVVMQEYSTLHPGDPGNPATFRASAHRLARMFAGKNPAVRVWLMATWSRPDMTYREKSPWHGEPIEAMAEDLQRAYARVAASSPAIRGVIPVGLAFDRAISMKLADPDPYDGIDYGKIDLWAYDNHHASIYGYYLEALMDFGAVTGRDPRMLGGNEQAASELGLSPQQAAALQRVAYRQLHAPAGS